MKYCQSQYSVLFHLQVHRLLLQSVRLRLYLDLAVFQLVKIHVLLSVDVQTKVDFYLERERERGNKMSELLYFIFSVC